MCICDYILQIFTCNVVIYHTTHADGTTPSPGPWTPATPTSRTMCRPSMAFQNDVNEMSSTWDGVETLRRVSL
jgi:hypothetical protein